MYIKNRPKKIIFFFHFLKVEIPLQPRESRKQATMASAALSAVRPKPRPHQLNISRYGARDFTTTILLVLLLLFLLGTSPLATPVYIRYGPLLAFNVQ